MPGSGYREGFNGLAPPFLVIAILDLEGQRRAGGESLHHAAEDLSDILFDFHSRPRPKALLAASQLGVNCLEVKRQPGGHAVQDSDQGWSVGLPRSQKA